MWRGNKREREREVIKQMHTQCARSLRTVLLSISRMENVPKQYMHFRMIISNTKQPDLIAIQLLLLHKVAIIFSLSTAHLWLLSILPLDTKRRIIFLKKCAFESYDYELLPTYYSIRILQLLTKQKTNSVQYQDSIGSVRCVHVRFPSA